MIEPTIIAGPGDGKLVSTDAGGNQGHFGVGALGDEGIRSWAEGEDELSVMLEAGAGEGGGV